MMNRSIKIFLVAGLFIGLLQGVLYTIIKGAAIGIPLGIISGFFVGGIITLLTRVMYQNKEDCFYKETLFFRLPYEVTFNLCLQSLDIVNNHKVRLMDISQGKLIAKLGMSIISTGEIITFQVNKIDDKNTQVEVRSTPVIPSPVYHYETTKKIISQLKSITEISEKRRTSI